MKIAHQNLQDFVIKRHPKPQDFVSLDYRFDIIVSVYFFLFCQFLKNPVVQQEILNVLSIEKSSIEAIVTDWNSHLKK